MYGLIRKIRCVEGKRHDLGKGRSMITGFGERFETEQVGGRGLASAITG